MGSSAPGPGSASRDAKPITFAKGIFQPSDLLKYIWKYYLGIPFELSFEMHLEVRLEMPFEMRLEIHFEIPFDIPFEIH